jgi:hypothetical protein
MMATILDRVPKGEWFALTVCPRTEGRGSDWVALLVDTPIDQLQDRYRTGRVVREVWVRIPGKCRGAARAWDAVEGMMATRH